MLRKIALLSLLFYQVALICHAQIGSKTPFPNTFSTYRFAHRGGYAYGPENTIQTILYNIREKGVKGVEIDIRQTRDGSLVLFHDETIGRILETDQDVPLESLTLAELQAIPMRDKQFGTLYVQELSTLVDSLRHVIENEGHYFIVEIDFKPHGDATEAAVKKLIGCIMDQSKIAGKSLFRYFFISTFYPEVLKSLRAHAEDAVLAFAVNRDPDKQKLKARLGILASPFLVKKYGCTLIEPNHCMVTKRYVKRWRRRGVLINAYTANSACEKAHLEKLGVAFTTNCPEGICADDASDQTGKKKGWCKACR